MLLDVEIHPKVKKGLGSIPFACYTFASITLPPSPLTHLSFRVYRNVMLSSFATFCVHALHCFAKILFFFINGGLNAKIMLLQMSFEQALDFRMSIGIKVHGRFCRF